MWEESADFGLKPRERVLGSESDVQVHAIVLAVPSRDRGTLKIYGMHKALNTAEMRSTFQSAAHLNLTMLT